ncbi:hypothetical protein N8I74_10825 [Chitiniphilus purpureus]|uniref:Uncharacterized protein n=1 Tax=Chitiniphilus purpureus TaxID=2981137 RepID=A0ABY6DHJ3_9NEIS|nr:hypothetical protein [Chitiniphilus sp. CD1]UXY13815.1 hypothetical protein N8I74_10825 [Chitiniphilus sp. CD1]
MIGDPKTGTLQHARIEGVGHEGLSCSAVDGRPLEFALLDPTTGEIVEHGPHVAQEAFNVARQVYRNVMKGQGWLRVLSEPAPLTARKAA